MARRKIVLLCLVFVLALPTLGRAQNYGDGFAIGGVLVPDSPAILAASRLGDSMGLELGFGLSLYDGEGTSSTTLSLSGAVKRYWSTGGNFQPYIGGLATLAHSSLDEGEGEANDTLFGFGAVLGGEYFLSRRVSLDGNVGVNLMFGSFSLSTGTRLAAFMYL
jgi:hypothetical protein